VSAAARPLKASRTAAFDQRRDAEKVVLHLAVPPSVNAIWSHRKGGGVRISDAYATWLVQAGWQLGLQKPGRVSGRYTLTCSMPRGSGADLDNLTKGLSDLLQLHGVIRNDRDAEEIHLYWQDERNEVIVEVRPFLGSVPA
jgi:crossover junction endodeoxyribonuclease RusA